MAISGTGLASLAAMLAQQAPTSQSPQDASLNARTRAVTASSQANLQNELARAAAKKARTAQKKKSLTKTLATVTGAAIGGPIGGLAGASIGASLGGTAGDLLSGSTINSQAASKGLGKLSSMMVNAPEIGNAPPPTSLPKLTLKGQATPFENILGARKLTAPPTRTVDGWQITG